MAILICVSLSCSLGGWGRPCPGVAASVRSRRGEGGVKAPPVLRGSDVECAQEAAAHRLGAREAAGAGDRLDRLTALLQTPSCGLQAHALDVARGRDAGLVAEGAREVARAHVRPL